MTCGSRVPRACHAFSSLELCVSRCSASAHRLCTSAWPVLSPLPSLSSPDSPLSLCLAFLCSQSSPATPYTWTQNRAVLQGHLGCRCDQTARGSDVPRAGVSGAYLSRPSVAHGVVAQPGARGGSSVLPEMNLGPSPISAKCSQPGPVLGGGVEARSLPAQGWRLGPDPAPAGSASGPDDHLREEVTHSRH